MKTQILILAAAAAAGLAVGQSSADASGWLEGTVLDTKGKPVWVIAFQIPGFNVKAVPATGNPVEAEPKPDMGGLFTIKGLRSGVYEVLVPTTKNADGQYRPQRIHGVMVKPGVRTMLNIAVSEGMQLQEVGRPVASEHALVVSQELIRLARQGEQLQKQVEAVQKQVVDLKR